jgi:hypothetical protein
MTARLAESLSHSFEQRRAIADPRCLYGCGGCTDRPGDLEDDDRRDRHGRVHDHGAVRGEGQVIGEISGGEYGVRGWIEALDANTGKSVRKAYSTGPGFKPFYDSEKGKDLGVTAWPPSAW